MDFEPFRRKAEMLLSALDDREVRADESVDRFLPLLEKMKQEGCVILLKLDGERTGPDDAGQYTIVLSQGRLRESLRMDAARLEDALSYAVVSYYETPQE